MKFGSDTVLAERRRERELELIGEIQLESMRRSLPYYLENFCYTIDEHETTGEPKPLIHGPRWIDPETLMPIRDLDGSEDDYLRYIGALWQHETLMLVPKSRQLRLSHLMVACHRWLAQFYSGQRIAIQSKAGDDADALLKRCRASMEAERKFFPHVPWPAFKYTYGRILFDHGSIMTGIKQGPDKVRSYTFSAILSDEMAFQEEAEGAYTAAIPTIDGGGKYTGISSANPGFFKKMVFDKSEAA